MQRHVAIVARLAGLLDSSRGGSLTGGEGVVPRCLLDWISVALVPGAIVHYHITGLGIGPRSHCELNIHQQVCSP